MGILAGKSKKVKKVPVRRQYNLKTARNLMGYRLRVVSGSEACDSKSQNGALGRSLKLLADWWGK